MYIRVLRAGEHIDNISQCTFAEIFEIPFDTQILPCELERFLLNPNIQLGVELFLPPNLEVV